MYINYQLIGSIFLDISLLIYTVQFIPQIFHNFFNDKSTYNISELTQLLMFTTIFCNIIQAVGYYMHWQYLAVAIIYLIGVLIQQIQISLAKKKYLTICNYCFIIVSVFAILAIIFNDLYITFIAGIIVIVFHLLYWFPQIYKNYKQKRFDGYRWEFIFLGLLANICDLISSFLLKWELIVRINIIIIIFILFILVYQKIIYSNRPL
ncbi:PQ-loop repeat-containing protein [Francisella tularensis subsp. novicida]|uniref:PQ-loop domain-containing transporter n=1 Tax=Francisella tularensis TaxID=263 RepID=UPI0008FD5681|nr:PQ loop repeat family protein [Francisella tularensis subsp. novicida]MBK2347081.1 PQ-loop repeat-containing protein [Francisella tularensis subsp. novicida]